MTMLCLVTLCGLHCFKKKQIPLFAEVNVSSRLLCVCWVFFVVCVHVVIVFLVCVCVKY